jgi:cysteine-rich repeat protein
VRRLIVATLALLGACAAGEREYDAGVDPSPPADAALPDAFEFIDAHTADAALDAAPDADQTPDASVAVCGNGVREGTEECDDGNFVATDGCLGTCKWARCGDGVVRTGVEECDDGNTANGDTCSAVCLACASGDGHFTWPTNNHCYTRFAATTTWDAAKGVCANIHAHLATIESDLENGAVTANLLVGTAGHWIGLADIDVEGRYDWVTGDPSPYRHFTDGEPNNDGNEDCIETSPQGLWNDNKCSATKSALCEDEGWFIHAIDNHAYHVSYHALTWSAALADCASLGAHLATVTSADEESFIETHAFGNLWGGLTDAASEGIYLWVTGEPYSYTDWQANEPSNGGAGEDCLELSVGRGWNDLACTELRGYVCEKD